VCGFVFLFEIFRVRFCLRMRSLMSRRKEAVELGREASFKYFVPAGH
jgi:hypothetical protein